MTSTDTARERLLVALDVETGARALDLAADLRGVAGGLKVGSQVTDFHHRGNVERLGQRRGRLDPDAASESWEVDRARVQIRTGLHRQGVVARLGILRRQPYAAQGVAVVGRDVHRAAGGQPERG